MSEKKTPDTWCDQYGLEVRDPDGWRRDHTPWTEPITLPEFWRRYAGSTAKIPTGDDYDRAVAAVKAATREDEAAPSKTTGPDPVMCVGCYLEHRAGTRHLEHVNDATLIVGGNSTCTDHIQIGPAPAIPGRTASGIIIGEGN